MTRRQIREEIFKLLFERELIDNDIQKRIKEVIEEEKIKKEDQIEFFEEYINGREISIGVIGEKILQPIEIVIEGGFYDYEKKYTPGVAKEICPANISEALNKRLKKSAKTVHDLIGFEVYSRTDFIVDTNDKIYFIETNSIPGMTPTSLLPKEAEVDGIDFSNLCRKVIELSIGKYQ